MSKIKNELEDLAFQYLDPAGYKALATRVEERAKAAAEAPLPAEGGGAAHAGPKHQTRQPWKKSAMNTHGFGKTSLPRKVGSG